MDWWSDATGWFETEDGRAVLFGAVVPFLAILVAGIVAAAIGRGSTKRALTLADREHRVAAVATLIGAARRAAVWNTLSGGEQQHADHVASEADVRVRLLGVPGSGMAADWAAHQLAAMKRDSVSFSVQTEQSLIEFRQRIVQWQLKPSRAKKLFKDDLELWAYEDSQATKDLVSQQKAWAAAQAASESPESARSAAPSTRSLSAADSQVGHTGLADSGAADSAVASSGGADSAVASAGAAGAPVAVLARPGERAEAGDPATEAATQPVDVTRTS